MVKNKKKILIMILMTVVLIGLINVIPQNNILEKLYIPGYFQKNEETEQTINKTMENINLQTTKATVKQPNKQANKTNKLTEKELLSLLQNVANTYIYSSVNGDWQTLQNITTGQHYNQLQQQIIPGLKSGAQNNYKYNSNSLSLTLKLFTQREAVATVNYVITKGDDIQAQYQEKITMIFLKKDNYWKISNVKF